MKPQQKQKIAKPTPTATTSNIDLGKVSRRVGKYTYDILTSPEYQKGTPELREELRNKAFDNYIKPYGLAHGLNFDRDTYYKNWTGEGKQPSGAMKDRPWTDYATAFAGKAIETSTKMYEATKYINPFAGFGSNEKLINMIDNHFNHGYGQAYRKDMQKKIEEGVNTIFEGVPKGFDSGWSDEWKLKLAGMAGEQVPQLPLYEATGMLGKIATGAIKSGPVLSFFAKKAVQASEGYVAGLALGENYKQALGDAAGFVIGGSAIEGAGALWDKTGGKFLGKMVSYMGRKGVQEHIAQAVTSTESHGIPGVTSIQISDPVIQAHLEVLNQVARDAHGRSGYNFLTPEQKIDVLNYIGLQTGKAAQKVATNAPEVFAANVAADLAESGKKSKAVADFDSALAAQGIKIAEEATKEAQHQEQHGIDALAEKIEEHFKEESSAEKAARLSDWAQKDLIEQKQKLTEPSKYPNRRLPSDLRGAKPRYSYGDKNFELSFQDERELALYIVAADSKSAAHDRYMEYLRKQFVGMSDDEIRGVGKQIRGRIKELAKVGDPAIGPLHIAPREAQSIVPASQYTNEVKRMPVEVPGAATSESLQFMDNVKKKIEGLIGDFHFENEMHGVLALAAYADRNKSEFPPQVRKIIREHLTSYFKPRGASEEDINRMIEHMPDLLVKIKMMQKDVTGAGAHKYGEQASVFASHFRGKGGRIRKSPTKWEKMLDSEFAKAYGVK